MLLFDEPEDERSASQSSQMTSVHSKHQTPSTSTGRIANTQMPKLLLVDELPNLHHGETLSAFCDALKLHLNSSRSSTPPLVLIISDTTLRPGQEGADNILTNPGNPGAGFNREDRGMNARTLLPTWILSHPACFHVRLNAVNRTIMKKMLGRVIDEDACFGTGPLSKHKTPTTKDLDDIMTAANGDIRSALNNLQFMYSHEATLRLSRGSQFKTTNHNHSRSTAHKNEMYVRSL